MVMKCGEFTSNVTIVTTCVDESHFSSTVRLISGFANTELAATKRARLPKATALTTTFSRAFT